MPTQRGAGIGATFPFCVFVLYQEMVAFSVNIHFYDSGEATHCLLVLVALGVSCSGSLSRNSNVTPTALRGDLNGGCSLNNCFDNDTLSTTCNGTEFTIQNE